MSAPTSPPPSLDVRALTVVRGGRLLFASLSFVAAPGTAVQLRGPNGAGKTSLLLALAGAIRPESGTISWTGTEDGDGHGASAHLLLTQNALKPRLSVLENLAFWQVVNGATGVAPAEALETVGLGGLEAIEAGHLSTGQSRRLALARLLVTRRPVWLLDEPTTALDTAGAAVVGGLIATHCAGGGIAIVATHHDLGLPDTLPRTEIAIAAGRAIADAVTP